MDPTMRLPVKGGTLVTTLSADTDHPGVSVDFEPAGETGQIPISYTEIDGGFLVTRVWGDADQEDPTHKITHENIPMDGAACGEAASRPPVVYVCAPYKGENMRHREQNIQDARMYALHVLNHGGIPYAAHLAVCGFLDDAIPAERQAGIAVDHAMMDLCDEIWVFGDTVSSGMSGEIETFKRAGKPVRYVKSIPEKPSDTLA